MAEPPRFIAPMPRISQDGKTWVSEVRRIEDLGFDTVAISHHVCKGWQFGPITAMAFAAAVTSRLRVLSLVAQNALQHPALLAKDIATIDRLSDGRVELGIGTGWLADDYNALGLSIESGRARVERLTEALEVITQYFTRDSVDFGGSYYRVCGLEALPRCVQQPNPPILVGAGGPRMLELAGRYADIVGLHARMHYGRIDRAAVADLTAAAFTAKIAHARDAAAAAGRPDPRFQLNCYYVHVSDAAGRSGFRSSWAPALEAELDLLVDSPTVLVGTAAECAERILRYHEQFGISYWHLGQNIDAASQIIERIR